MPGEERQYYPVVSDAHGKNRGSDWAVLALGYRLALGVTTSIFFFCAASNSLPRTLNGLNAFKIRTRPIKRARMGKGMNRHRCGTS